MKEKGFTLIELLAVIVILAIISLIAVPIILNIIEDVNENAFKETINGIVRQTESASVLEQITDEKLYKYENNAWVENKLEINGTHPRYIEVKINKEGKIRYAITDGKYCAQKEYDGKLEIKNVPEEIKEQYCKLDVPQPTEESCFKYTVSKNKVTITDYYNNEGNNSSNKACPRDVVIPEEIEGKNVTGIAYEVFKSKELTSVVIPEGVTEIGNSAFDSNQLTSVTIPNTITEIGYGAFRDNQLPDDQAFIYNRNRDGSIDYTSLNSYGGKKRNNVIIPSEVNEIKLIKIGCYAFERTKLTSVTIPNSVTSIGASAFRYNNMTSITIPSSVTSIGESAFADNDLTSVTIPNSVTTLSKGMFDRNNLTSVEIPSSVTSIGESAFRYNDITSITIPSSVTSIGKLAFDSNQLRSVTIPSSVTSIGGGAFTENQLSDDQVFIYNRKSDGSIDYTSLNSYGGKNRDNVVIPSEVNGIKLLTIGSYAFLGNDLTSVTIPNSVTNIEKAAFDNNRLTNIEIPSSVTNIGELAFWCNHLTSVTIPSSVTSIGVNAFGFNSLKSVKIIGKSTITDFASYPKSTPFGWATGYNDEKDIKWIKG